MSKSRYCDLELAELESELRNAYVRKVLDCQIREKEAEKEIKKIREDFATNLEKMKIRESNDELKTQQLESARKREQYKRDLEDQMMEKDRKKRIEEEEAWKERRNLEEADRIVEEQEIVDKYMEKKELAERLNRERIIFEEMKKNVKRIEAEIEEETRKRNEEYLEEIERRSEELEKLHKEQKRRREELINEVAKMLVNLVDEKRKKREAEIADLVAEEIALDIIIQEREDELRRKKMHEQLARDLEDQMIFTQECAKRSLERDKIFAETVMKRIMEEKKIEMLTQEAKIRSRILYREDLRKMMDERRRVREIELERMKIEFEKEKIMEQMKKEEIREARRQLLIRHADNVAPYVKDKLLTQEEQNIVENVLKNTKSCTK